MSYLLTTCKRVLKISSLAALAAVSGKTFSQDASQVAYAQGNYRLVLYAVVEELGTEIDEYNRFLNRLRLATNSFAQSSEIPLDELMRVYDAAGKVANRFQFDERLRTERGEVSLWLTREKTITPEEVLASLENTMEWSEESLTHLTSKTARLFALALLARRKCLPPDADAAWFFLAGKALGEDTGSGVLFFEIYLDRSKGSPSPYRREAIESYEQAKRDGNDGRLSPHHARKIKQWKREEGSRQKAADDHGP